MPQVAAAVFDAYGTLLDVNSAMERHADRLGPDWQRLSTEWRAKQLEYSWVRSLAGPNHHRDFSRLTDEALKTVAARNGIEDQALLRDLEKSYRELGAYPEVLAMLTVLRESGVKTAVLSNGERAMLGDGLRAAKLTGLFDDVLSADAAGVFKPDMRVYRLATERFGVSSGQIAFMSSNPWDAFGAREFGFRVYWVNRTGQPDEYGLRGTVTEISDLSDLPALLG